MISKEWVDNDRLIGKVCLVTGATSGIGKETALALAELGANLVITGRNREKTKKVTEELKQASNNDQVNYLIGDFSDLDQVRNLANEFNQNYEKLHVLINNAGIYLNRRELTKYGVEKTFLVNHLAPFLLTNLLLDKAKNSCSSRIINISSDAHKYGKIHFGDLELSRFFTGMKAYSQSKLANILFTYELSRRLDSERVCVNALHPGHVSTKIWTEDFGAMGKVIRRIVKGFTISSKEGADNSIYLAASRDINSDCGKYYIGREAVRSSTLSYDEILAKKLWELSEELVIAK